MGSIGLPTDASNTIPPLAFVAAVSLTGVYCYTLSGSVVATIQHNGVAIAALTNITITTTPTLFSTTAVACSVYDTVAVVPSSVSSALGLVVELVS